jgi:hypothetical protein
VPAAKFRKKPVVIEAIQFHGSNVSDVREFTGTLFFAVVYPPDRDDPEVVAEVWDKLHSTWVGVKLDQWIIKGVQGEFYPCDEQVFEDTYEPVED